MYTFKHCSIYWVALWREGMKLYYDYDGDSAPHSPVRANQFIYQIYGALMQVTGIDEFVWISVVKFQLGGMMVTPIIPGV